MIVLGVETSCDETSVAVVENGTTVLSNCTASTARSFAETGGVIPEDAARQQVQCMLPVLHQALNESGRTWGQIDAIAITCGPGLMGSLLVGTTAARMLAAVHGTKLIGVHHTLGHLSSTWLDTESQPGFPSITLSVSGGHSDIWLRTSHTKGTLLGRTRDDAAGEAFDKGASMLGLPYPGGPSIAKAAADGDRSAYKFPLPLQGDGSCDFSFSGLKTALKYTIRDAGELDDDLISTIAASYEHALCMHLVDRLKNACNQHADIKQIHLVGGVSANQYLRQQLSDALPDIEVLWPSAIRFCTDNAAMIASAGYFMVEEFGEKAYDSFVTGASISLDECVSNG